jgi:hypothetical protein
MSDMRLMVDPNTPEGRRILSLAAFVCNTMKAKSASADTDRAPITQTEKESA